MQEQKYAAVMAVVADGRSVSEVAQAWGVSRQSVHAWLRQYEEGGLAGLAPRSSRPASCPHQMPGVVEALVLDRFGVTATIVVTAIVLATLLAVGLGLIAAAFRGRPLDRAITSFATVSMAIPSFWLGLMLILVFGVQLQALPVVGYVPLSDGLRQGLPYIILPVATLATVECGVLIRMMRASAIDVLGLDYVTHARAKGLSERRVLLRHVFPNAFAPTMTLVGLTLGHLLGGAVVVETVFTLPGLGRLVVDAVLSRDYPVVQGCLLFTALVYVLVNLATDLLYPVFDPRVRLEG